MKELFFATWDFYFLASKYVLGAAAALYIVLSVMVVVQDRLRR